MKPTTSVLMPVYNAESHLAEAIESILAQTHTNFELLIVYDDCTDRSLEIVNSYSDSRIRLIRSTQGSIVAAMNLGLDHARGEFVAMMDADDISHADRLERQVTFLNAHAHVGGCGTWVVTTGALEGVVWRYAIHSEEIRCELLFENACAHPSIMYRSAALERHRLRYSENFSRAADYEFLFRCTGAFAMANIPTILLTYRIRPDSHSRSDENTMRAERRMLYDAGLRCLGIEASPQELELHASIGALNFPPHASVLNEVGAWLRKLLERNAVTKVYSPLAFEQVVKRQWYSVHQALTGLGLKVWLDYSRSPLGWNGPMGLRPRLGLLARCALKQKGRVA
jgi:glycosyltransferase involved in cell wall biosynthesis